MSMCSSKELESLFSNLQHAQPLSYLDFLVDKSSGDAGIFAVHQVSQTFADGGPQKNEV